MITKYAAPAREYEDYEIEFLEHMAHVIHTYLVAKQDHEEQIRVEEATPIAEQRLLVAAPRHVEEEALLEEQTPIAEPRLLMAAPRHVEEAALLEEQRLIAEQRRAAVEEFRLDSAREYFVKAAFDSVKKVGCCADRSSIKLSQAYAGLGLDLFGVRDPKRQRPLSPKQAFFGEVAYESCPQCRQSYDSTILSLEPGRCLNCGAGAWMDIPVFASVRRDPLARLLSCGVSPKTPLPDLDRGHLPARPFETYPLPPPGNRSESQNFRC